LIFYKYWFCN